MDFRIHGGPDDGELEALGLRREDILDFSASTNPRGPSDAMRFALRAVEVSKYPDTSSRVACQALAAHLRVPVERLVLGNGAAELLWTLRVALSGIERGVVIAEPTFCEFRAACVAADVPVFEVRARPEQDFRFDLQAIAGEARANGVAVVYLCCPNTPTGAIEPAEKLASWAAENPQLSIVLDQSFLTLSDRFADLGHSMPDNVICVRSLTKDHGVAGVRVGYLLAVPSLIRKIAQMRPAWTVSAYSQAAVLAAVAEPLFVQRSREELLTNRNWLQTALLKMGLRPVPSSAPFVLVKVPNAAELRASLLKRHRLLVRNCQSFGLPGYLRLSVRTKAALECLIEAMAAEL